MIELDEKKFVTALNEVAATDNGKIVLAALKDSCQWDETYLSSEDPQQTHFFAVKRGIYGGLRRKIKTEHLKDIEFNYKWIDSNDGRDKPKPTRRANPSTRADQRTNKSTR